jgi:hypothetical protein
MTPIQRASGMGLTARDVVRPRPFVYVVNVMALDKLVDKLTTKAALAAGKDAVDDLLSSDDEKAQKETERAAEAKSKRQKRIAYAVVGLLIVIGVLGLMLSYWHWFLLAGLAGLAGIYGWRRLQARFADDADDEAEANDASILKVRVSDANDAPAEHDAEERARDARATKEARAIDEQEIDDELAAMKARLDK